MWEWGPRVRLCLKFKPACYLCLAVRWYMYRLLGISPVLKPKGIPMAKRWNGRKMSHGSKNLPRPLKKVREKRKKDDKNTKGGR